VNQRVKLRRKGFTRLSTKRQVTLPIRVVEELNLHPGDELRVQADGDRVVLSRATTAVARRLNAIDEVAGTVTGVWKQGDLERLRDEWR
jgi:AbrB family looped-hinge helix DNA binding protein